MAWMNPSPGTQVLWIAQQKCVHCGDPASHLVLRMKLPKGVDRQTMWNDPTEMAGMAVPVMCKPYCTICSPVIAYIEAKPGLDPVPEGVEPEPVPRPKKKGWFR